MNAPLVPTVIPPGSELALTARDILAEALAVMRNRPDVDGIPTLSLAEDRALRICVATIRALAEDHAAKNPAPILQLGNVTTEDLRQLLLESPV